MHLKLIHLVSLFCFVTTFAFSQNETPDKCTTKIVEQTDSVSGNFTRSFKEKFIVAVAPKERLEFDLKQFNEAIVISVLMKGTGDYCFDETSKMVVKFVSGQMITLPMDGKFNCDNEFASFFGGPFGKKKEFRMFLDKEIETLRVEARKSVIDKDRKNFMEVKFTELQRKEFMERLDCLVD